MESISKLSYPCRESEIDEIEQFILTHITKKLGGTMYISGPPGTGKSAVIQFIIENINYKKVKKPILINCFTIGNSLLSLFSVILKEMNIHLNKKKAIKSETDTCNLTNIERQQVMFESIKKYVTKSSSDFVILILDEMDQLLSSDDINGNGTLKRKKRGVKGQFKDHLTQLFELAETEGSKLIVIGIANSLNLINRHFPTLLSDTNIKLLQFHPYDKEQIAKILQITFANTNVSNSVSKSNNTQVFDSQALKFVATKVASSTGDIRKALSACKAALEQLEATKLQQGRCVLQSITSEEVNGSDSGSPRKKRLLEDNLVIGLNAVSKILHVDKDEGQVPTQQLFLLGTCLKFHERTGNQSGIPISVIYQEYQKIASDQGYDPIEQSDMISMFGMLEDRSLVQVSASSFSTYSASRGSKSSPARSLSFKSRSLSFSSPTRVSGGSISISFDPLNLQNFLRKQNFLEEFYSSFK